VTDARGLADAMRQFSTELDAAVVRARRVAAEARETSARFRGQTRQLAARVKAGTLPVSPDGLTDERLRRAATGFRDDNGLPVDDLPRGAELVARAAAEPRPVTTPSPVRTARSGRAVARPGDDDEDFSQQQIMR
jgi:hypothetical protein